MLTRLKKIANTLDTQREEAIENLMSRIPNAVDHIELLQMTDESRMLVNNGVIQREDYFNTLAPAINKKFDEILERI